MLDGVNRVPGLIRNCGGTADDLIEELLAAESKPRAVTVVSNDLRLHEAARRAGGRAWGSQEFLDCQIAHIAVVSVL